jgi:hypothetical protein
LNFSSRPPRAAQDRNGGADLQRGPRWPTRRIHAAPSVGLVNERARQIEGGSALFRRWVVMRPAQRDDRDPDALADLEFNLGRRAVWFY